jgi:hypothetical protein
VGLSDRGIDQIRDRPAIMPHVASTPATGIVRNVRRVSASAPGQRAQRSPRSWLNLILAAGVADSASFVRVVTKGYLRSRGAAS